MGSTSSLQGNCCTNCCSNNSSYNSSYNSSWFSTDEEVLETAPWVSEEEAEVNSDLVFKVYSKRFISTIKKSIPLQYEYIKCIGYGAFGPVVECQNRDTQEVVVVKIPVSRLQDTRSEVRILRRLMEQGADQRNIVKFFGSFKARLGKGMIFEKLDMTLDDFWSIHCPLPLSDIRTIIQQVATALEALKEMSLIHGDLHMGNIMICDHTQRPLTLKVFDFGWAMSTAEVTSSTNVPGVKAPEVILGMHCNEAVDVWSLGILFALMLMEQDIFPTTEQNQIMKVIVHLFGTPSASFLDTGTETDVYFVRIGQNWIFEDDLAHWPACSHFTDKYNSLRHVIEGEFNLSSLEDDRDTEAATLLLGRMLEADHDKRITPSEILQHPFIRDELENPSVRQLYIPTEDQEDERDIFNKPLTREEISAVLPEGFKVIKMLGSGRFGQVFNCRRVDTGKSVTIKLPYSHNKTQREIQLLETIAEQKADHKNIVTFIETLPTGRGEALVLEELSMNLASYIKQRSPLPMSDIRAVIQQTATALQTLESKGIIHTGVTMENIWLCHRSNEPIKIKLADFGAFIEQKRTIPGMTAQRVHYRAPEIILGLPFDEAIDVWSLGTMLVTLLTGFDLFPDRTEFETLTTIVKIFGQPPDYVLSEAVNTHEYFNADGASWKIKTAQEFEESSQLPQNTIKADEIDAFDSLDEVIQYSVAHSYDSAELAACIDLVKAMLTLDGTQRITPAQILEHDFISMSREVEAPVSEEQVDAVQKPLKSPVFITVKPASPENTTAFVEDPPVSKSFTPVKGLKMSESTRSLTRLLAEAAEVAEASEAATKKAVLAGEAVVEAAAAEVAAVAAVAAAAAAPEAAVLVAEAAAAAVCTMPSEPVLREKPKTIAQFLEQDKLQSGRMQSKMEARLDTEEKTKSPQKQKRLCWTEESPMPKTKRRLRWKWKVAPMPQEQLSAGSSGPPKQKKKNCFQKILSWFRRASCFCSNTVE